ncbi:MAG: glycosyltransferase [Bacteroidota bacterium]
MRVCMAGYQAVSILRGGPHTQIRGTAEHLPEFGVTPQLFDPWSGFRPGEWDLFHLFAANIGTYHLAREIHALGVPLVVSPVIYSRHSTAFVRTALGVTRLLGRAGRGIWSDYGLAADICGWASRVVPNTEAEAHLLRQGLGVPGSKIRVIPNGVEERFAAADPALFRKQYGLEGFILNVGHTGHERKNVLNLIRALAGIPHPAVIIGRIIRSPYGERCREEAARHRHILLLDGLPHESPMLASAYAACDVFVLPSEFETPGIAALEAALAGAKIVMTPHGGTREYFGEMADYVEPSSVESIREGIRRALARARTPRLRDHVLREYTWRSVARKTAALYAEVAGGAPAGRGV